MPQASIEFEVTDADRVQAAAEVLTRRGFTLLNGASVFNVGGRPSLDVSHPRA